MLTIVDVETSGLSPGRHHIVEVAAVVLDRNLEESAAFSSLANPGEKAILEADPGALMANKITPDMIRQAPRIELVAAELSAFLDNHWGATIHSFNMGFDRPFLDQAPWSIGRARWGECVMLSAMEQMEEGGSLIRLSSNRWKFPKLSEAAAFFKVKQQGAHRALHDARTAALVYKAILEGREEMLDGEEVENIMERGL